MAVYDNKLLDGEHLGYFAGKVKAALNGKQDAITSSSKLDYALLDNVPIIPTVPSNVSAFTNDAGFITASDIPAETEPAFNASAAKDITSAKISAWDGKQDALVFNTAYNASSNKVATMSDIASAVGSMTGFHFEVVQTLPATGEANVIYLVLKSSGISGNVYTEYAYINNAWEQLGDTNVNLSYLSNSEIDSIWSAASAE